MIAMIVVNLSGVVTRRQKLTKKYFIAFLVYLIPSLIAMTIQAFVNVFILIVCAVSLSVLSMLGIILTDQMERYMRQQSKISDQRTSIAVLQMRPHFIYNTMLSIYYLCEQNPKKAQQVTLDFTTYLRKNFNAIASDNTIPFSEELEHTRAYVAVEQAQFDDNLIVEYDTPHILFRVPTLTLQPIVENAVKHGMDPDADEPLHIFVRTRKTDLGNEIIVEDNGTGLGRTDNNEPHIALKNIRERLSLMCGGSLEIDTRENGGTRVIIRIP
jgi:LytS/YehU family sensor histidine kinase